MPALFLTRDGRSLRPVVPAAGADPLCHVRFLRHRALRVVLILVPVALVAAVLAGGAAATCRPSWYQPPRIDYARLQDDKRAQLRIENEVSAALNAGRAAEIVLEESQVNRWIAARDELWPGQVPSLEPFQRPQLTFLGDGRVRLAALVERAGVAVVLSATFRVALKEGNLLVEWDAVHAGLLPAPATLIEDAARKIVRYLRLRDGAADGDGTLPDEAARAGHVTLPAEATWPNGRRRFRVTQVAIEPGSARIRLEPVPGSGF